MSLWDFYKETEHNNEYVKLTELRNIHGMIARSLSIDLKHALANDELIIYYQPQYNNKNKCIGAEALLRWRHPMYGMIYPPLIITIADEVGILNELEQHIIKKVSEKDYPQIKAHFADHFRLSVNVSAKSVLDPKFNEFLIMMRSMNLIERDTIWLEITEQMALTIDDDVNKKLSNIKELGYPLIIDDFSMGYTSFKYLQQKNFSLIKLDGDIIKNMEKNPRCLEIIASIASLSESLGCEVLAEYVETEQQREKLEAIGCYQYQGYLYNPALPLDRLLIKI